MKTLTELAASVPKHIKIMVRWRSDLAAFVSEVFSDPRLVLKKIGMSEDEADDFLSGGVPISDKRLAALLVQLQKKTGDENLSIILTSQGLKVQWESRKMKFEWSDHEAAD